jgi:hypothetical protein
MEVATIHKKIHVKRGAANSNMLIYKGEGNEQRIGQPTDLIVTYVLYRPNKSAN